MNRRNVKMLLTVLSIAAIFGALWWGGRTLTPFAWIRFVDALPIPGAWKMWLWGWR